MLNTDAYIYNLLKSISQKLCKLNPDHISLIRIVFILLAYNSELNKNKIQFVLSILISAIFDLLDGDVARYCKKTTKFGGYLDLFIDRINFGLLWYYLINYYTKYKVNFLQMVGILIIYQIFVVYLFGYNMETHKSEIKYYENIAVNNSVLINIIYSILIIKKF